MVVLMVPVPMDVLVDMGFGRVAMLVAVVAVRPPLVAVLVLVLVFIVATHGRTSFTS